MAQIKQVGIGRKSSGTIDGITYVTRGGVTYARSAPTMPASAYKTPDAKRRQAIFKMIQMHLKYHLRTIRQTFTPKGNGTPSNRYYSLNSKGLTYALDALADAYVAGADVTLDDVETAISAYAAEHPTSIRIASLSGYQDVFLTGDWPETITLNALAGDSTMIIIVAENGTTTTINPDGSTVVTSGTNGGSSSSNSSSQSEATGGSSASSSSGSSTGGSSQGEATGGSSASNTVTAPVINGDTTFTDSVQVTMTAETGAEIRYTTDGSTPTASSTLYSDAITLSDTTTVKAIAIKDGNSSSVSSKTFTKSSGDGGGGVSND